MQFMFEFDPQTYESAGRSGWARIHVSKAFLFLSWILWTLIQAVIPLLVVHWRIQRYIQNPVRRHRRGRVIHVM